MLINSAILAINNGTSAQIVPSYVHIFIDLFKRYYLTRRRMELTAILRRSTLVETRYRLYFIPPVLTLMLVLLQMDYYCEKMCHAEGSEAD